MRTKHTLYRDQVAQTKLLRQILKELLRLDSNIFIFESLSFVFDLLIFELGQISFALD